MKGRLNISIDFPIVSLIGKETVVFKNLRDYTMCPKNYVPELNKIKEFVFDSKGTLYERGSVRLISKISFLGGFSLKFAGFGIFYVEKDLVKLKDLSKEEVINYIKEIFEFNKNELNGDISPSEIGQKISAITTLKESIDILFYVSDPTFEVHLKR